MQNAETRNDSALREERPVIAELRHAGAAEERADGQRGPLRGLGQRVGGVQFFAASRWTGRIAARPLVKNGDATISSPLSTYSSHVSCRSTVRMKQRGDHGADQVARDHDALAVQAVEHHAGQRARPASPEWRATASRRSPPGPIWWCASARLKTAMLLKWSPTSLTTWPIHVLR